MRIIVRHMTGWAVLLVAGLLLAPLALAESADHDAQQLVRTTAAQLMERLEANRDELQAHPEQIFPLVEDLVLPHFDFELMSQQVLAVHWRRATPEQRERFTRQFRDLLVRTYAMALLEYSNQSIGYLPTRVAEDPRRVLVRTEVRQPGGPSIPIHYRMYLKDGEAWKVYDLLVEGISLVTNYRTSYATELRRRSLDELIDELAARNRRGETE